MRFLALLLLITGCAHSEAWVVEQVPEGGVIGYTYADKPEFREKFDARASSVCGDRPWKIVRDKMRSNVQFSEGIAADQAYGSRGQYVGTVYHSTTHANTVEWREATIECRS